MCLLVQWPFHQHHYSIQSWHLFICKMKREIVKLRWSPRFLSIILIYYCLSHERHTEAEVRTQVGVATVQGPEGAWGPGPQPRDEDTWSWKFHPIHLRIIISAISWLPNVPGSWCPPHTNLGNHIWTEAFRDRTAVADGAVVLFSHWSGTEAVYVLDLGFPAKQMPKPSSLCQPWYHHMMGVGRGILGYRNGSIHKLWPAYYLGPQMDQLSGPCISSTANRVRGQGCGIDGPGRVQDPLVQTHNLESVGLENSSKEGGSKEAGR